MAAILEQAEAGTPAVSHSQPWANPAGLPSIPRSLAHKDAPLLFHLRADRLHWESGDVYKPASALTANGEAAGIGGHHAADLSRQGYSATDDITDAHAAPSVSLSDDSEKL
ncbi:hypothetical protein IM543_14510 [Massilia sp. UMI-21]|nr:hypothetical protein IM543_14510 [Massilia sp. UMI-21]